MAEVPKNDAKKVTGSQMDRIYGGVMVSTDEAAPWMNCGYIDPEWSDVQIAEAVKEFISEDFVANKYIDVCTKLATEMYESIPIKDVEDGEAAKILDCGCGYGAQTILMKTRHPDVNYTGINISGAQIEVAKKYTAHLKNVNLQVADATDLSAFTDTSFTNVYALECAFHFETRQDFLNEAGRVLKPGGALATMDCLPDGGASAYPLFDPSTRKRLGAVFREVGILWFLYLVWNRIFCNCLYGRHSWPSNEDTSSPAGYEAGLRKAGFTGDIKITDVSGHIFFYNSIYRHHVLGIDKGCCARWFDIKGWCRATSYLMTEWSANPYILAILCRKEFSPYVLVTAYK